MLCPNCNTKLEKNVKFCSNCGYQIIIVAGEDIYIKEEKLWRWTLYIATVLSSSLMVSYLAYWVYTVYTNFYSNICNEPMFKEFFSCGNIVKINIPYYKYIEIFGIALVLISAILQIISYLKLKNIYKYNLDNNITRPKTIYVKKNTYLFLASSFGMLGLHKFYVKKNIEGIIYLGIFIGSFYYQPLLILLVITTSIALADFTVALAQKKDSNKNIMI